MTHVVSVRLEAVLDERLDVVWLAWGLCVCVLSEATPPYLSLSAALLPLGWWS